MSFFLQIFFLLQFVSRERRVSDFLEIFTSYHFSEETPCSTSRHQFSVSPHFAHSSTARKLPVSYVFWPALWLRCQACLQDDTEGWTARKRSPQARQTYVRCVLEGNVMKITFCIKGKKDTLVNRWYWANWLTMWKRK